MPHSFAVCGIEVAPVYAPVLLNGSPKLLHFALIHSDLVAKFDVTHDVRVEEVRQRLDAKIGQPLCKAPKPTLAEPKFKPRWCRYATAGIASVIVVPAVVKPSTIKGGRVELWAPVRITQRIGIVLSLLRLRLWLRQGGPRMINKGRKVPLWH